MRQSGFTLIEVVVFLLVSGLLMTTILLAATTALRKTPEVHQQWEALQAARGCMEWFLEQRRLNGYDSLACPSSPSTAPCITPAGYNVSASVACTSWQGDSNYKSITISVSGLSSVSLTALIGDYS